MIGKSGFFFFFFLISNGKYIIPDTEQYNTRTHVYIYIYIQRERERELSKSRNRNGEIVKLHERDTKVRSLSVSWIKSSKGLGD